MMDFKKGLFGVLSLILAANFTQAQVLGSNATSEVANTYQWDDISVFRINKEPAKAFFILYDSLENALKPIAINDIGKIYQNPPYTLLNSDWHFLYLPSPNDIKAQYFNPDFDTSKWDKIDLPDTWQTRGYDRISYMNIHPEFICDFSGKNFLEYADVNSPNPSIGVIKPQINELHRQSAIYRKDILLDDFAADSTYILRLGAAKSGVKIFVNGKFAGYSEDSFTPAEFDISKFLKKGKNTLAIHVFKYTTGSYLEVQDMPHVMGIIRDVVLIKRPKICIADIVADAVLDGKDFKFASKILAKSKSKNLPQNLSAELIFTDSNGKILKSKSSSISANTSSADLNLQFKNGEVLPWSPDKPNLYQAIYQLKLGDKVLETAKIDVGFRTFFIDENLSLIWNGVSMKLKGVNRHNYAPQKGSAVDFETLKNDILAIKNLNINAIRTSHYPNPEEFYLLCNRLGVFVLDENNLESHSLWTHVPGDSGTYDEASCDRMQNMVKRDRNQPCVFAWSLGNENANHYTKAHKKMEEIAKEFAPEPKLVHCEPATYSDGNTSSFHSPMYGSVFALDSYLSKPRKKPFMFCEYCFAVGNSVGNLYDVWQKMRSNPALLGGFLWDWADRTLIFPVDKNDKSEKYLAYGIDFGTCRNAGVWCASGLVDAFRNWYPKTYEVQCVYQDIQMQSISDDNLTIKITNEFADTDLKELKGTLTIYCNGDKLQSKPISLALAAGKSADFKIDLPNFDSKKSGEYFYELAFEKDSGLVKNVSKKRFFIKRVEEKKREILAKGVVNVKNKDDKVEIQAADLKLVFDKNQARLESLECANSPKFISPFELDISCAWLDNFSQAKRDFTASEMDKLARIKSTLEVKKLSLSAARVSITQTYANENGDGFDLEKVYTILGGGFCEVAVKITKLNETLAKLYLPRVGLKMLMPKDEAISVKYLGYGPNANYNDKMQAANFGKWSYKVADDLLKYANPQDCGNRQNVEFFEIFGKGRPLVIVSETKSLNFALLPNTQDEILKAQHYKDLPLSDVCQLRIAPLVAGVGNGALVIPTLEKYRPYFEGSVEFKFVLFCPNSKSKLDDFFGIKFADNLTYKFAHEEKNRIRPELVKKMEGDWISKDAKIEYSSLSKEYHHKDGNPLLCKGENYAFHTERTDPIQYAIVDLGSVCNLSGMYLYNRKDGVANRTNALVCYLSKDGKNWNKVWESKDAKASWKVFFKEGSSARYVKIELRKKEYFHLSGIKIIGKK